MVFSPVGSPVDRWGPDPTEVAPLGLVKRLMRLFYVPARALGVTLGASLLLVASGRTAAAEGSEPRWCAPEVEVLTGEVCLYVPLQGAGRPTTVVIFLHSLVGRGTNWQWEQQRTMVQAADRHGFAVLMPRGRLGVGPGGAPDIWAWPTAQRTEAVHEPALVAEWASAREAAEKKLGRFERALVYGFSSGAYYAASLALRNPIGAQGYAVFAGGSGSKWKANGAKNVSNRPPVFVGYGTKDPSRRDPQAYARLLKELDWPHRLDAAPVGHTVTNEQLRRAFEFLTGAKEATKPRSKRNVSK
jgi:predicted esterase